MYKGPEPGQPGAKCVRQRGGRLASTGLAVLLSAGSALAQIIDLSAPFGNEAGCANRNGQEIVSDDMMLLTASEVVTSASACTILETRQKAGGALEIASMCEFEGEDAPSPTLFTVARSQTSDEELLITDTDGEVFGVVSRCK